MPQVHLLWLLLLVAAPGQGASSPAPTSTAHTPLQVDSYYGDYRVAEKLAGLPAKSLEGPRREDWISPQASRDGYRLGVLFPHLKDPYWRAVNYGIVEQARMHNLQMQLASAGGYTEIDKQQAQLDALLMERPDGIILAAISYTALDAQIEKAAEQGIPVVAVVNDVYSPRIQAKALVSFFEMGHRAAEFIIADAADGGQVRIAFFPGPRGSGWAPETLKGFFRARRENPGKIKLFPPRWGDTNYAAQRELVETFLLERPDIDYIVGNAVAAEVAADVLAARGLSQRVKIVATYLTPTVFDKLKQGTIAAAPSDITVAQGRMAVDMMIRLWNGETPGREFPFRAGPIIVVVTADNVDDYRYEEFFGDCDFEPVLMVKPTRRP